jgi:hypothetical protein
MIRWFAPRRGVTALHGSTELAASQGAHPHYTGNKWCVVEQVQHICSGLVLYTTSSVNEIRSSSQKQCCCFDYDYHTANAVEITSRCVASTPCIITTAWKESSIWPTQLQKSVIPIAGMTRLCDNLIDTTSV